MVLQSGYLKIGYELWQKKEEELREGFNVDWIQILPDTFCTFEQFMDTQENPIDPELQDNVLLPEGLTEYV